MRIGPRPCSYDSGSLRTKPIISRIPEPGLAQCTAGESLSMQPWPMPKIIRSTCRAISTISRRPRCYITRELIPLFLRSRRAQIATLIIVLICAASAWPVYEFGEQAENPVISMADKDGQAWLAEHKDRAEDLIYFFYALALLSALAIVLPIKWPKSSAPLMITVILFGAATLGIGGYIAYAGGKIRHREFRNEPPPKKSTAKEQR